MTHSLLDGSTLKCSHWSLKFLRLNLCLFPFPFLYSLKKMAPHKVLQVGPAESTPKDFLYINSSRFYSRTINHHLSVYFLATIASFPLSSSPTSLYIWPLLSIPRSLVRDASAGFLAPWLFFTRSTNDGRDSLVDFGPSHPTLSNILS